MAVSNYNYLKGFFNASAALGEKTINSDAAIEIVGFEQLWLLAKQFPWPVATSQGEIETNGPLGMNGFQPQQARCGFQGPITLSETRAGMIDSMLIQLLVSQGKFNANIYEGTPIKYLSVKPIYGAFLVIDAPDRDWENRSQPLTFSGTLFYNWFGETLPGNSSNYA